MTDDPHASTMLIWARLMRAGGQIAARIEAALKAEGLPPLGWYAALWEIEQAGSVRPLALHEGLLLPQYAVSRLVQRLVQAGLVARSAVAGDGRGQVLHLTPEGKAVRARMWPVYASALRAGIEARLQPAQALGLARGLGRLLDGVVLDGAVRDGVVRDGAVRDSST